MKQDTTFEPTTKKFTLVGTFDRVTVPLFLAAIRLGVYAVVTGCHGKNILRVALVYAAPESSDEDEDIVVMEINIDASDPLETVQFAVEFIGSLAKPGVYYIQLRDDIDRCLIERRIVAQQSQPPLQGPLA